MKLLRNILAAVCLLVCVIYGIDSLSASKKLDTIGIHPMLAVPKKNGRTEFIMDEPYQEQCVHALFPHAGASPCWYVLRHTRPIRDM